MKSRVIYLIIAFAMLAMSVLFLLNIEEEKLESKVISKPLIKVMVQTKVASNHNSFIQTVSKLQAKEIKKVVSGVDGTIVYESKQLKLGKYIKKGETLLKIDNNSYKVALNESKYRLLEAKYELLKEDKKYKQALRDWEKIEKKSTSKVSDLALNIPQLNLAKANVALAKNVVTQAKIILRKTIIKAPISGYITAKFIDNSHYINQASELFTIQSNETLIGEVELNQKQWSLLIPNWKNLAVKITDTQTKKSAKATLTHGGGYIDESSNLYKLFFEVDKSDFVAGDFVQLDLPIKVIKNSIKISSTAMDGDGVVWYVDANNTLRNFITKKYNYNQEDIIISLPNRENFEKPYPLKWSIVVTPLSSFFQGIKVYPIEHENR